MSEKTAIYPGFFDPITNGHLSVIKRALQIFDRLIIAILNNPQKVPLFSIDERTFMIRDSVKGQPGVEVDTLDGPHEPKTKQRYTVSLLDDRL
jgi:pantetheine-phosphate adenylyltransferase